MATLAGWAALPFAADAADHAPPRPPRRVAGPLLMGDILASQGGTPVFLRDWREAEDRAARDADQSGA